MTKRTEAVRNVPWPKDPKVTLEYEGKYLTLTIPELRPETVKMIMEDARSLIKKLDDIMVLARKMTGQDK